MKITNLYKINMPSIPSANMKINPNISLTKSVKVFFTDDIDSSSKKKNQRPIITKTTIKIKIGTNI